MSRFRLPQGEPTAQSVAHASVSARSLLSPRPAIAALAYGAGVSGLSLLVANAHVLVLAAVTGASFLAFVFLWSQRFRPTLSYVDPGLLFQFVIVLYTVFPLVTFWYYDFQFGNSGDSRLAQITLDDNLISSVWLCANLAMAGFGTAYLVFRKPEIPKLPPETKDMLPALWTGFLLSGLILMLVYFARGGEEYVDEYLFYEDLPRLLVQVLNISSALFQASVYALLACYFRTRPKMGVALGILVCILFLATTQARAGLVLIAAGMLIAGDHFRKRFSPVVLAATAAVGLTLFLVLGLLRGGVGSFTDAAGRTEFMALFVTALDIRQLYIIGSTLDMNANLLVSDLVRLIPQQVLPFEKVDPATWYVSTFYPAYAESGGGLAFGLIAEAVLGGGGAAALVRGLALGGLVSVSLNYLSARVSLWRVIIYMWLFANLYQSFRDTTFTLVARFVFQFAPAVLILMFFYQFLIGRDRVGPGGRATMPSRVDSLVSR
jgi:hypothetical protein